MGKTILYIEDNPDNVLLVQRAVESRGHKFSWSPNGTVGLMKAVSDRPDLILLDINLPDIDGYEVARKLRAHNELGSVPILAVTIRALEGDTEKALTAGCNACIPKPIKLHDLWAQLDSLL